MVGAEDAEAELEEPLALVVYSKDEEVGESEAEGKDETSNEPGHAGKHSGGGSSLGRSERNLCNT